MPSCRTSPPSFSLLFFRCLSSAFVTRSDRAVVSWPPLPSVHASVRASVIVVAICFCARRVSSVVSPGSFLARFLVCLASSALLVLLGLQACALLALWFLELSPFGFLASGCGAANVPRFGPLCYAPGLCATLRAVVPCFGSLCLASGILRTRLAPSGSACAIDLGLCVRVYF